LALSSRDSECQKGRHLWQSHAKRVCSERFSALWEPIGAFGVEINQPLVALAFTQLYRKPPEDSLAKQVELERIGLAQLADIPEDCRRGRPCGEIGFGTSFGKQWGYLRLITVRTAQSELELTKKQMTLLKPLGSYFLTQQTHWARTSSDKKFFIEEMQEVESILSASQIKRMDQIIAQRKGIHIFFDPRFQEEAGLSDKVVDKIQKAWARHVTRSKQGWSGRDGQISAFKVWELALGLLNKKQRVILDQTTGPLIVTFDLPAMQERLRRMERQLEDQPE
jgi:hypothetical protein